MSSDRRQTPFLSAFYQQYLDDQDTAEFINQTSKHYAPATLRRLAEHHGREVRRAAVLVLGFVGDYSVNPTLGRALSDDDRLVRTIAENGIRSVWSRAGNQRQRRKLDVVVRLNAAKQFNEAIRQASELIENAPWFAEAWHQRAIARFHLRRFSESIRDCHQALEVNPYHFVAAKMMGQAYLELGNHVSALESFRRALRLNPNLEGVRLQVVRLARMVEDK